jgi:hypothetical protein
MMPTTQTLEPADGARPYRTTGVEFRTISFRTLHGPAEARGPFAGYDEVVRGWRDRPAEPTR